MKRKNFVALAEYLGKTAGYCEPFTERQIEHLANFCHSQNPGFCRDMFLASVREKQPSFIDDIIKPTPRGSR